MGIECICSMLRKARDGKYAVGGYVFYDYMHMKAMTCAAAETASPMILQSTSMTVSFMGIKEIVYAYRSLVEDNPAPIALHLDHGKDMEIIKKCIELGYTSVMIDASSKPFNENIEITRRVVDMAHGKGVSVEAELGTVGGKEDDIVSSGTDFVDPGMVEEFIEKTGVDALAVGIGTVHGIYKKEPNIRFDLIEAIAKTTQVPLVMHGGTGLSLEVFKKSIACGISKINVGTEFKQSFSKVLLETVLNLGDGIHPHDLLLPIYEATKQIAAEKFDIFGSIGKAS